MTDEQIVEAMTEAFGSCTINTPHASMHAALAVAKRIIREAALREAAAVARSRITLVVDEDVDEAKNTRSRFTAKDILALITEKPHV